MPNNVTGIIAIEIKAQADSANAALSKLTTTLSKVSNNLTSVKIALDGIADAASGASEAAKVLTDISDALSGFNSDSAKNASSAIRSLKTAFKGFTIDRSGMQNVLDALRGIVSITKGYTFDAGSLSKGVAEIKRVLKALSRVEDPTAKVEPVISAVKRLSDGLRGLDAFGISQIGTVLGTATASMNAFNNMPASFDEERLDNIERMFQRMTDIGALMKSVNYSDSVPAYQLSSDLADIMRKLSAAVYRSKDFSPDDLDKILQVIGKLKVISIGVETLKPEYFHNFNSAIKTLGQAGENTKGLDDLAEIMGKLADISTAMREAEFDVRSIRELVDVINTLNGLEVNFNSKDVRTAFQAFASIAKALSRIKDFKVGNIKGAVRAIQSLAPALSVLNELDGLTVNWDPKQITGAFRAIANIMKAFSGNIRPNFGAIRAIGPAFRTMINEIEKLDLGRVSAKLDALRTMAETLRDLRSAGIFDASGKSGSGNAFSNFIEALRAAFERLKALVESIRGVIMDPTLSATEKLISVVLILKSAIEDVAQAIWSRIRNIVLALKGMVDGILQVARGVVQVFNGTVMMISAIINKIIPKITEKIKAFKPYALIRGFITAIAGYINSDESILGAVWNGIKRVGALMAAGASYLGSKLREAIPSKIKEAAGVAVGVLAKVGGAFKAVFAKLFGSEFAKVIGKGLKNVFQGIWKFASNAVKALTIIAPALYKVAATVGKIAATVYQVLKPIINVVGKVFSTIFNTIKKAVSGILNAVKRAFNAVGNAIRSALSRAIGFVKTAVSALVSVFGKIGGLLLAPIRAMTSGAQDAFSSLGSVMSGTIGRVQTVLTGLSRGFKFGVSAVKTFGRAIRGIAGVFDKLKQKLNLANTAVGALLKRLASRAFSMAIRALIRQISTAFKEGLQDLAKQNAEVAAMMDGFTSQLNGLKAAAGSILYSLLSSISGVLSQIISLATAAANAISQLFAGLGGQTTYFKGAAKAANDYTKSNKKAGKSAKQLQGTLMGFDEINQLNSDNGSGGGSGAADSTDDAFGQYDKSPINEKLLKAIHDADFTEIGREFAEKINGIFAGINWDDLKSKLERYMNMVVTGINGFVSGIDTDTWASTLNNALSTVLTVLNKFWYETDWSAMGAKFGKILNDAIANGIGTDIGKFLARKIRAGLAFATNAIKNIDAAKIFGSGGLLDSMLNGAVFGSGLTEKVGDFASALSDFIRDALASISVEDLTANIGRLSDVAFGAFKTIFSAANLKAAGKMAGDFIKKLAPYLVRGIRNLGNYLSEVVGALGEAVFDALEDIDWSDVEQTISGFAASFGTWLNDSVRSMNVATVANTISGLLNTAFGSLNTFWQTVDWKGAGQQLGKLLSDTISGLNASEIGQWLFDVIKAGIETLTGFLDSFDFGSVVDFFSTVIGDGISMLSEGDTLDKFARSIVRAVGQVFGSIKNKLNEVDQQDIDNVKTFFVQVFQFAADLLKEVDLVGIIASIINILTLAFNGLTEERATEAIKSSMSGLRDSIEKAFTDLIDQVDKQAIADKAEILLSTAVGLIKSIVSTENGIKLGNLFADLLDKIDGQKIADAIGGTLSLAIGFLKGVFTEDNMNRMAEILVDFIRGAANKLPELLKDVSEIAANILRGVTNAIVGIANGDEAFDGLYNGFISIFDKMKEVHLGELVMNFGSAVVKIGTDLFVALAAAIAEALGIPKETVDAAAEGIRVHMKGLIDFIWGPEDDFAVGDITGETDLTDLSPTRLSNIKTGLQDMFDVYRLFGENPMDTDWSEGLKVFLKNFNELTGTDFGSGDLVTLLKDLGLGDFSTETGNLFELSAAMEKLYTAWANTLGKDGAVTFAEFLNDWISSTEGADGQISELVSNAAEAQQAVSELNGEIESATTEGDLPVTVVDDTGVGDAATDLREAARVANDAGDEFVILAEEGSRASEEMANVADEMAEIPVETLIAIKIDNYTNLITNIRNIAANIRGLPNKTIKIDIRLSNGAVNLLNQLKSIGAGQALTSSDVNRILTLNAYAKGGMGIPNGDLFLANESGAEMVGTINGKTAVANQQEIGDAIFRYMDKYSSGNDGGGINETTLANAIVSSLKSAGMGAVYLDGKQLAQSIRKESKRIGRSAVEY